MRTNKRIVVIVLLTLILLGCFITIMGALPKLHENMGAYLSLFVASIIIFTFFILDICNQLSNISEKNKTKKTPKLVPHKKIESKTEYLAYHDPLTELPNRRALEARLNRLIGTDAPKRPMALFFVDLNRYKKINDFHGRLIGDQLLNLLAKRLKHKLRHRDFIARLEGDEFVIVIPLDDGREAATSAASEILHSISNPIAISEHEFHLSASIGISLYPDDGDSYNTLLRNADIALFHAKEMGTNNYQFFDASMLTVINIRSELETAIRMALNQNEFVLYYQPKCCLKTNKCTGVEALLRWRRENLVVDPESFIDVAIESGLIVPITEWLLRSACQQLKWWRDNGHEIPHIAVNITARFLADPNVLQLTRQILEEAGLDGGSLEFEITENVLIKDIEQTQAILHALRRIGVKITVDDFGTGYSSFRYLKLFQLDCIKIDKSFIRDMLTSVSDLLIVKAIIAMGKSLGVKLIAEGVENHEQLQLLANFGCDEIQGYYYCRPNTAVVITSFMRV